MRILALMILGLMVVGCGKSEPLGSGNEYNAGLATTQTTTKANPVKELTAEEKQKALRDSVVGEYEGKNPFGRFSKLVFLENGVRVRDANGKKQGEYKWSIVDGEIHIEHILAWIAVYRINPDKSITRIAVIRGGKRKEDSIKEQSIFKRIK